eukprot:7303317-Lingulodinium_polyedra.AAC.1
MTVNRRQGRSCTCCSLFWESLRWRWSLLSGRMSRLISGRQRHGQGLSAVAAGPVPAAGLHP